jgi:hypothetical protein
MREREMRRRLHALEGQLPQFQPPPSPLEQIQTLAMRDVSQEALEQMINMARDRDGGMSRTLLQSEVAAMAEYEAALETEARRMGFESFADAERRGGRRR